MGGRKKRKRKPVVLWVVEADNGTSGWIALAGQVFHVKGFATGSMLWQREREPKGSRIVFRVARYVRAER